MGGFFLYSPMGMFRGRQKDSFSVSVSVYKNPVLLLIRKVYFLLSGNLQTVSVEDEVHC